MNLFPGFGGAPAAPKLPPPPPPVPTIEDPAVTAAAEQARIAAEKRKGRAATLITGGQGDTSTPNIARPEALGNTGTAASRGAKLLGG
jgi:hypothetical protein